MLAQPRSWRQTHSEQIALRAPTDCCRSATHKYLPVASPDELWKTLSADDMLARMDHALWSLVSLWPVVLGALVAGCLLAYAI